MEDMSRHIVISLILLLIFLFFILLSNRIYNKRQLRLQQLQHNAQQQSSNTENPNGETASWRRVPGSFARTPSGNGLRFIPSPQGDVFVRIPLGVELWHSRQNSSSNDNSSTAHRGHWNDTPSVWGIDLDTRGRGGNAILVPAPGGLVLSSTTRGPARWGRRQGVDEEAGHDEGECLPRYEEPPPGYEKVLEEDTVGAHRPPGSAGEGSSRQPRGEGMRGDNVISAAVSPAPASPAPASPAPAYPEPSLPEPAVTRDRPVV